MTHFITILEKEGDSPFNGMLTGFQKPAGIIFIVAGILAVYIGIKALMGYKFFPEAGETVIEEKKYTAVKAKVLKKLVTEMPSFNGGGMREFVEWEITYDVGGVVYTQVVPDDGYSVGDELSLMYSPDNPQEYYIDKPAAEKTQTEEEPEKKVSKVGIGIIVLGVLLAGMGIILLV